jgi:hypothetical protein
VDEDSPWILLSVLSLSARPLHRKRKFYIDTFVATSNLVINVFWDYYYYYFAGFSCKGEGKAIPLDD